MIVIGANLQQILTDLKNIVHSPIKPYVSQDESIQDSLTTPNDVSDDDLACLINRIMGRRKFHISMLFMSLPWVLYIISVRKGGSLSINLGK